VDPELTSAAGKPGHEIVEVARRVQAKTIVLGEHHHGFLAKLFGGDVAAGVRGDRNQALRRDLAHRSSNGIEVALRSA
jgi:hypothetical protein